MKAMIPGKEFELRKAQAAVPLAAILAAIIRAVIREVLEAAIRGAAIPAGAVVEAILQETDPTADNKTRTLKTTPKCSR